MDGLMMRRRGMKQAASGGMNYLVPSQSAGEGSSVASVEEGNILNITTLAKGGTNRVVMYFNQPLSLSVGDIVRWVLTKETGSLVSSNNVRPMLDTTNMQSSYVNLNQGFDVSYTVTTAGNYSTLRLHNSSNPATGSGYSALTKLYVNGTQVI